MRLLKSYRLDSITKDTPGFKIVTFVEYVNLSGTASAGPTPGLVKTTITVARRSCRVFFFPKSRQDQSLAGLTPYDAAEYGKMSGQFCTLPLKLNNPYYHTKALLRVCFFFVVVVHP